MPGPALLLAAALAAPTPAPGLDEPLARTFSPGTKVEGSVVQVMLGERALVRLDDKGLPVLIKVEKGQLADAHPAGAVIETFAAPPPGEIAIALDGSAEKRATILKVWNGAPRPLAYSAIALVLSQGQKLEAGPAPVCPAPAHGVRVQSWPRPVVAVGLSRFRAPDKVKPAACG
jgi:hypothetical protein